MRVLGHTDLGGGGLNGHVEVLGDHAYVGSGSNGGFAAQWNRRSNCDPARPNFVKVVSLANPADPRVVSNIPVDAASPGGTIARDVSVIHVSPLSPGNLFTGDLLAIALEGCAGGPTGRLGFELYDVTDPANPRLLSSNSRVAGSVLGVATRDVSLVQRADGRVLALEADQGGGIAAFDVSNPAVPVVMGSYENDNPSTGRGCRPFAYAQGVTANAAGSTAYAAYGDNGLLELDLSAAAPGATFPVSGEFEYPAGEEGNSFRFVPNAAETAALATDEDPNPAQTTLTIPGSTATEPGGAPGVFRGCEAVWGKPLYEQATPTLANHEVVFVGSNGCEAGYAGLDVTDKIVLVDRGGSGDCFDFDGKARIAQGKGAVALLIANTTTGQLFFSPDATEPGDAGVTIPVILMRKEAADVVKADPDQKVTATLADTPETWGALRILDLSGADPTQTAVFNAPHTRTLTPGEGLYHAVNPIWAGDTALVAWMSDGMRTVDVSNRSAPQPGPFYVPPAVSDPSGNYPTVPLVVGVARHGASRTVITDINGGLYVLGGALPATPSDTTGPLGAGIASFPGCRASSANLINGTAAGDRRNGTLGGDRIFTGAGNDVVDGLAGNDCIDLGPGVDRGQGGLGDDLVVGGLGNDRVSGSSGNDRLRGDAGDDRLSAGRGNDRAFGDGGRDRIAGGFGNDRLHGVGGRDRIAGSRGRDRINGGSAGDVISGGSSNDRVAGDQGNDRINGNSGKDALRGNSGRDRINGSSGRDRISGGPGNDRIRARDGRRDRINCGSGRDRVSADAIDRVARNCERISRRR